MQPYEMLWRTDENGVPMSIAIEEQFIVGNDLYLVLEEIPDSYQRVSISTEEGRIYESMNRNQLAKNRFYVDYNNGIVYFDSSLLGKKLTISYYGRGYKRIHSSRVIMSDGSILSEVINQPQVQTYANVNNEDNVGLQEQINNICNYIRKQQKVIELLIEEVEKLQKRGDDE